ncbi:latexin [Aplochiton taeniatus]
MSLSPTIREGEEEMYTGELKPHHYPAQRAAKVVQHYLNTIYGSPFQWIMLEEVHSANAEVKLQSHSFRYFFLVSELERTYQLELSVKDIISNPYFLHIPLPSPHLHQTTEKCSGVVVFPEGDGNSAPQVNASCDALLKNTTKTQEEAFYQQYKASNKLVTGDYIPDSYGHIDDNMKPFWHLGGVAASFIMLRESNESSLYNMAQVANVTQLETQHDQLRFNYHVLLHELVSQEIIHWKLLVTWSPTEGAQVLQTEFLPKCHHCVAPSNNTTS